MVRTDGLNTGHRVYAGSVIPVSCLVYRTIVVVCLDSRTSFFRGAQRLNLAAAESAAAAAAAAATAAAAAVGVGGVCSTDGGLK